ncbi:DUF2189 domain-containing protein [Limibaculum sp. FT325]|uniref:DUF2189 domain-containing protein n=1 Tax=Thermohalobaculum sediminis TaxID=2939436 RepID=UPI0020BDDD81|nr:DUF2189 domain-containing protein [Limibaculum sediminis]MCL5778190.1 DUF2189 domain-containing protein [Limibaculum sediminis]
MISRTAGHLADEAPEPAIRQIGIADIRLSLARGWEDFLARPTSMVALFVVYPAVGFVLSYAAFDYAILPLLVPIIAGFALVGPLTTVGVFELSRKHEAGARDLRLADALSVLSGPSTGAILRVGLMLFGLFVVWLVAARQIVFSTIGAEAPAGLAAFLAQVATTPQGQAMFILGNGVGFLFALAALVLGVFSLPMLVDGETSAARAMATSLRACAENPVTIAAWGLTVAVLLALAMLPLFAGLVIVLPWLGHATWHLYRAAIDRAG